MNMQTLGPLYVDNYTNLESTVMDFCVRTVDTFIDGERNLSDSCMTEVAEEVI